MKAKRNRQSKSSLDKSVQDWLEQEGGLALEMAHLFGSFFSNRGMCCVRDIASYACDGGSIHDLENEMKVSFVSWASEIDKIRSMIMEVSAQ